MAAERQGSRWLNEPPTEQDVRDWFGSQNLHDGMTHDPYIGGVVVIGATEKYKVTKQKQNGDTYTKELERSVFTPYVKVDTRVAYFWDYVRSLGDGYYGVIEPVTQRRIADKTSPYYNDHLPEGFSFHVVKNRDESVSRFLVATQRVAVYREAEYAAKLKGATAHPVLQGIGNKQVPAARQWADDNAMMKAETGAVGRALGMAGVLVVGTGIATAEDMQEAQGGDVGPAGAVASAEPALPEVVAAESAEEPAVAEEAPAPAAAPEEGADERSDEEMRQHALALQAEMEKSYPQAWEAYKEWWRSREFGALGQLTGPALKGALIKLERDLDAAKQGGAS